MPWKQGYTISDERLAEPIVARRRSDDKLSASQPCGGNVCIRS
jgi:hypothetical protein